MMFGPEWLAVAFLIGLVAGLGIAWLIIWRAEHYPLEPLDDYRDLSRHIRPTRRVS